ncbi:galactan beta-1,4-galactosyltransferase gals3 [Nicotiana attenuata]|uniref:Galactan beta-1,4-galactosyltransferase gals3 n=1 Tax=Nicotiana attenuata TaxID=49451 RepID=A0A314LFN9_NICAT|nr:galactan beta-1,4-galactosyltransferase gals3 [Nicotiana attenuata]
MAPFCRTPLCKKLKAIAVNGSKILPDWGYVGSENGGKLVIHAATSGDGNTKFNSTDTFIGLTEREQDFINFTAEFNKPPKYDFLYGGSSLYGSLSPQIVREWLAFHVRLFGEKSHFVIHDAGGIHEGVIAVLKPWMKKRYVTLQDIRDKERFDGYCHNQFLILGLEEDHGKSYSLPKIRDNSVDLQEGAQKRYGHLVPSSSSTVPLSDNMLPGTPLKAKGLRQKEEFDIDRTTTG